MADQYLPFTGDLSSYGAGPEHQFFLWDAAAQAAGQQPAGAVPTPTPRPAGVSSAALVPNDNRDGSNFGIGATGERARDVEMMGRGRAPFTGRGIATALGNAASIGTFANPMGALVQAGMRAARAGIGGQPVGAAMSPVQNIPGQTPYDRDLIDAVGAGRMTRAQADGVQRDRNDRGHEAYGGGGRGAVDSHGQVRGGGTGGVGGGGGITAGGPRADGGRVGYQGGGGVHEPMMQRPPMRQPFVSRIPRGIGPMDGGISRAPFGLDSRSAVNPTPMAPMAQTPQALPINKSLLSPQPAVMPAGPRGGFNPMMMADGGISGAVDSPTPGRADAVDASAADGSYVIPADVVSALGDGNSEAGHAIIDQAIQGLMANSSGIPGQGIPGQGMISSGDSGQGMISSGDSGQGMARGGVPIRVSGGEHIVHPHAVMAYGRGSHRHGAAKLDAMIRQVRERTATKLQRLPSPR